MAFIALIAALAAALVAAPVVYTFASSLPRSSSSADECLSLDAGDRTIKVTCDLSFGQISKRVAANESAPMVEKLGEGEYLLDASIIVSDGARLTISAPEVKWLKISNRGSSEEQHSILVNGGYMDINGVKITSWDPAKNTVVYQNSEGSIPRPFIRYQDAKGGVIQNSELAHMGYDGEKRRGFSLGGTTANILIKNNDFHHWWYAFYSAGAKNVTIDGNEYHDNYLYAIDPHAKTHDMKIANNHVYHNAGYGIICSEDCYNIMIEGNRVHDNPAGSITLSKNMHNSTLRNNLAYNSEKGINFNASPDNVVYNNTIRNVTLGFYITQPKDGSIADSTGNRIYNNTVEGAVIGAATNLNTDDNVFANNTFRDIKSFDFFVEGGSEIAVKNQTFTNYKIAGNSGAMTIGDSGAIEIEGMTHDTDASQHEVRLRNNVTVTVSSK